MLSIRVLPLAVQWVCLVSLSVPLTAPAAEKLRLWNVVPAWEKLGSPKQLPIAVAPFTEHVGSPVAGIDPQHAARAVALRAAADGLPELILEPVRLPDGSPATSFARLPGGSEWFGTARGLFTRATPQAALARHEEYGVNGPLSTRITALAVDGKGTLWVGTPLGLSLRSADGNWSHRRGREGLPVEDITALAIDNRDNLWIGTSKGAILHRPYAEGRKWFYRQGPRYLPDDRVTAVALSP